MNVLFQPPQQAHARARAQAPAPAPAQQPAQQPALQQPASLWAIPWARLSPAKARSLRARLCCVCLRFSGGACAVVVTAAFTAGGGMIYMAAGARSAPMPLPLRVLLLCTGLVLFFGALGSAVESAADLWRASRRRAREAVAVTAADIV